MPTYLWVIIVVAAVIIGWLIMVFNSLIRLKNRTQEAFSDVDVQLKRRHDLIPNLMETVKGYAQHEKELFEKVTQARSNAINAQGVEEKGQAENVLSQTLKSIFAVAENYPDLKASQNFLQLQDELSDTENKIQAARRFYNGNVRDFNTKTQTFPNNLVVGILGFKNFDFFQAENGERENVQVKF
ncbi:MAG: LemA family protein [Patescibacteria group bacterium]|jgi:LemA protein|nr:LemA family protein [Patescibacteria group bacterium]